MPAKTDQAQMTERSPKLAVQRDGHEVTLTVTCADIYAAMTLYDEVCDGARAGHVELILDTKEATNAR